MSQSNKPRLSIRRVWSSLCHNWPVIAIVALLALIPVAAWAIPGPGKAPDDQEARLELKASDIAGGVALANLNEYVTLVLVTGKEPTKAKVTSYHDLRVVALPDEEGHIGSTGGAPDSLVLAVPELQFDGLVKELTSADLTVYAVPQGGAKVTLTPMPEQPPTPTLTPIPVVFSLEAARIPSALCVPTDTNRLSVILVVETKDDEGKVLSHQAHRYDDVNLVGVYDENGTKLEESYTNANKIEISLPLAYEKSVQFAAHLADADQLYVIPLPTLTPTPTPTPSEGG